MIGMGREEGLLTRGEIERVISQGAAEIRPDGKRIVVLIPDLTRSAPMDLLFECLGRHLAGPAKALDFMIALGTHQPLPEEGIRKLVGMDAMERARRFPKVRILNHEWQKPGTLAKIGRFPAAEVAAYTQGMLNEEIDVLLNRHVLEDYDLILICGPVFPHEVVGMSGGNKYLFPGVSGDAFLQFFHWLGALITNPRINGNKNTPVRQAIDRAAAMVPVPRLAFSFVVVQGQLAGIFFSTPEESWSRAADLSARRNIRYVKRPFSSILAEAPAMYDDLWVGGKCMYKLEPAVADGGELIILAPHITEVSYSHGKVIEEIGYHTRDYFVKQWDRFRHYPWGLLAHSTHVRGIGSYENGIERPRVAVTLATGIAEQRARKINLGFRDFRSLDPGDWMGKEDQGRLYVPHAGEILFRLEDPPEWQRP